MAPKARQMLMTKKTSRLRANLLVKLMAFGTFECAEVS